MGLNPFRRKKKDEQPRSRNVEEMRELPAWASALGSVKRLAFFEGLVRAHFKDRDIKVVVDDGWVMPIGEDEKNDGGQFGLQNLAQACAATEPDDWMSIIERHFDAIMKLPRSAEDVPRWEEARESLALRLWDIEQLDSNFLEHLVWREDIPGIMTALMLDSEGSTQSVSKEWVREWGVEEDELFSQALANVQRMEGDTIAEKMDVGEGPDVVLVQCSSIYGSALALELERFAMAIGEYGCLVSMPVRELIVAVPISSLAFAEAIGGVISLTVHAFNEGPGACSPKLFWYRAGMWTELPYEIDEAEKRLDFSPPESFTDMLNEMGGEE